MAAEEKKRTDASDRAKQFEKILLDYLERLKKAAKDTGKTERFGVILKAKSSKTKPQYKMVECKSKDAMEDNNPGKWWGLDKEHGALMVKPGRDGLCDVDKENVTADDTDNDYVIEYDWHTSARRRPLAINCRWRLCTEKRHSLRDGPLLRRFRRNKGTLGHLDY